MFIDRPFELWRYVYWLPGLNFIRVPSRFIILTMLALSVLAAFGFDRIDGRGCLNGRESLATGAGGVAAARRIFELSVQRGARTRVDDSANRSLARHAAETIRRRRSARPEPRRSRRPRAPADPGDAARDRALAEDRFTATAAFGGPLHEQLYLGPDDVSGCASSLASLRAVGVTYDRRPHRRIRQPMGDGRRSRSRVRRPSSSNTSRATAASIPLPP